MRGLSAFEGVVAVRLLIAGVAGAAIGLERELRDQAAGLRTHMLVSMGSCLFALISAYGFDGLVTQNAARAPVDPSRVAAQIVTGVGFLGAGAIIRHGLSVRGLTTAASLWVVAAIGTAVGIGMYWATTVTALLTIASLWGLRAVRGRIRSAAGITREILTLRATNDDALDAALDILRARGYMIRHLRIEEGEQGTEGHLELSRPPGARPEDVIGALTRVQGLLDVDWDSG